jgi:hypothetical protein
VEDREAYPPLGGSSACDDTLGNERLWSVTDLEKNVGGPNLALGRQESGKKTVGCWNEVFLDTLMGLEGWAGFHFPLSNPSHAGSRLQPLDRLQLLLSFAAMADSFRGG